MNGKVKITSDNKTKYISAYKSSSLFERTLGGMANFLLFILALIWMFPFYWALACSLKTEQSMFKVPPEWIPLEPNLNNYIELINKTKTALWSFNSLFVSVSTMVLVCLLGCLAGYAFAKIRFKGREFIFYLMMSTMMLPKYVLLVPLFRFMKSLNWFDTYSGLIIPEAASALPFGVFLMRQFIRSIPSELMESARIDGCTELGIFARIVVPLTKPALAALSIFTFVRSWNDYMWQLIATKSSEMKTLPLGIAGLQQENVTLYGHILAGAMLSALPLIIVFIVFQQYFTRGLTLGAVKG